MEITRKNRNILAIVLTVPINLTVVILAVTLFGGYGLIVGWYVCPIYGGVVRSLVANRKDLLYIIPGMAILDFFIFVPLTSMLSFGFGWYYDLSYSWMTAATMVSSALLAFGFRVLVERYLAKKRSVKRDFRE